MASFFISRCWICDEGISLESCPIDEFGEAVHAKCYAAKLARRNVDPLLREKEERAWELCGIANTEQDREKFIALIQEIRQLLQEAERLK